jgi:hypothetical protein
MFLIGNSYDNDGFTKGREIIFRTLSNRRDFFGFPQDILPKYLFFYTATFCIGGYCNDKHRHQRNRY